MPAILAYWKTRALAQPIRLLLHYVNEPFEDKMYEVGDGPEFNKDVWYNEKYALGLDFPNLPYFIDDDIKLTQSNAILLYIGRKHDLLGKTEKEKAVVDMLLDTNADYRDRVFDMTYSPHYEKLIKEYQESGRCDEVLTSYENWLSKNKWFGGEEVTVADFPIYELLDQHKLMIPGVLDSYPRLTAFVESFEALPSIRAYMDSPDFMTRPVNNKYATFK